METERETIIAGNRQEFGTEYDAIRWITPERAVVAEERRLNLLKALTGSINSCCNGAKLYTQQLSPGCRLCTQGAWSCLFVNGICNGRCFYCPAEQTRKGEPTTNTLHFPVARDFVEYMASFQIPGVGFSGGEPLLTLDRTLQYLDRVKKRFGDEVHAWMYTNGMLLTHDKLKQLQDAGLNEIRFDISADQYSLDKVAMAVGRIATVTIEIPAVPEDKDILRDAMLRMNDLGVDFLNLHQLRLTNYNRANLAARPYTFLHGPKVTVLESELTALEMLQFAIERTLRTGVNYCSFIYRHRYQSMGARRRAAMVVRKPHETVTNSGHLRNLTITAPAERLEKLVAQFEQKNQPREFWSLSRQKNKLAIHGSLLRLVDPQQYHVQATYHTAAVKSSLSYQNDYKEVRLGKSRKLVVERRPVVDAITLDPEALRTIQTETTQPPAVEASSTSWLKISRYEESGSGLQPYF